MFQKGVRLTPIVMGHQNIVGLQYLIDQMVKWLEKYMITFIPLALLLKQASTKTWTLRAIF